MNTFVGRQEQALSMLTQVQNQRPGGSVPPPPAQVGGTQLPPLDTIRRDEVNAVLANQRELVSAARDIKNFVADVHNKVKDMIFGLEFSYTSRKENMR